MSSSVITPPAHGAQARRITTLDGIRGIAILLVMLIHFTDRMGAASLAERIYAQVARAGWVGVDLFFVLSGFLITGQLLESKGLPFYFRNFYARRTLRIFPLYYAFLAGWLVAVPLLFSPLSAGMHEALAKLHSEQAWYWTYFSNWRMGLDGEWPTQGISVYWSLAIEEQFYLVWPAVVLLCSRRRLIYVCGALVLAAVASRLLMLAGGADPLLVYVSTPTRMDGLAVGAAIAALRYEGEWTRVTRAARWTLPVAAACLAALWFSRRQFSEFDPLVQTAGFTLLALLFGSLLVTAMTTPSGSLLERVLGSRVLRFFGKYSYAMYLLHLPLKLHVVSFERALRVSGGSQLGAWVVAFVAATAGTAVLAWLSWHLWEKHFLGMKPRFADAAVPPRPVQYEAVVDPRP